MSHMTSVRQMPSSAAIEPSPAKPLRSAKSYMTPTSSSKARIAARIGSQRGPTDQLSASLLLEQDNARIRTPVKHSPPTLNHGGS